ncbi:imidazole glycerol phosphate synthase subunit HisH [Agaribacter flavus]|uniref:Imidazole glycerol phosphate synthase subunit HisH n=1 Tax=Agaribacter flavus TaxID=1902781 RepID=A0ABV7FW45_9ALTE
MSQTLRKKNVTIINTGCANIASVKFAFERLGAKVLVSDDVNEIKVADHVVLPGVGAAPVAMKSIQSKALTECIQGLEQPVLGVCLGMQLMVTSSQEADLGCVEDTTCLNLMPGKVERMQVGELRLPHMGWNQISIVQPSPLFNGIDSGSYFYFVHSYAVSKYAHTLASCEYGGAFSAAIHRDNFFGVQFHPERSSDAGAQLLENFLNL